MNKSDLVMCIYNNFIDFCALLHDTICKMFVNACFKEHVVISINLMILTFNIADQIIFIWLSVIDSHSCELLTLTF